MPADNHAAHRRGRRRARGSLLAVAVDLLFFGLLGFLVVRGILPVWLPAGYLLLSGVAFAMYRADKSAASISGRRRTPESTLHTIDLLGGWPGALVARHVFRHKTVKQPFRTVFWITVLANGAVLAWLVHELSSV
ncbi:DUF1294 domain-containing protein [Terracoccus sp. 273MFTsu3.1]|uniref:DUF1294 domain-containing protein n=1 Tax=Terracoccus sp. 273MFTsu3.1 TaxID=1172188 RepID=UPI0003660A5B|nr:DUF1294 domain-containing protein [Terracoccus sp. 273MFTsu3.1]